MTTLMQASHQWSSRPDDERFTSLTAMRSHFETIRNQSAEKVVPSRRLHALPTPDNKGIEIVGPNGHGYSPTHWSFSQVAALSEAPAGYLRTLPSPIAADCINYGLQYKRNIEDVGVLLQKNGDSVLRAATGPRYGRVWNADLLDRHTASAPDRYLDEMRPALVAYANGTASSVVKAIDDARAARLDDVDEFLANRFGKRMVQPLKLIHKAEEDRPIETRWDVVTAATAYARSIEHQDARVDLERQAGALLAA